MSDTSNQGQRGKKKNQKQKTQQQRERKDKSDTDSKTSFTIIQVVTTDRDQTWNKYPYSLMFKKNQQ